MTVKNENKKEFVQWLLKNNQMKTRECVWILNHIINNEELLSNVHFTEDAHLCPKAMIMSTKESSGIPFRFYKGSIMTADAEKAFHDMRINPSEELYIQINIPDPYKISKFVSVLENNSFADEYVSEEDRELAEKMIEESIRLFKLNGLEDQINEAIDNNDKEKFLELSSMMAQI